MDYPTTWNNFRYEHLQRRQRSNVGSEDQVPEFVQDAAHPVGRPDPVSQTRVVEPIARQRLQLRTDTFELGLHKGDLARGRFEAAGKKQGRFSGIRGATVRDPMEKYLADLFTVTANLLGAPAVAVPAGEDEAGRPVGMQFLAPPFAEERLLAAAAAVERSGRWPVPGAAS